MTTANIPLPSQDVPLPEPDGTLYQGYNKIYGYSIGTLIAYGNAREAAALARIPTDSHSYVCFRCWEETRSDPYPYRTPTDDTLAEDEALVRRFLCGSLAGAPEAFERILARVHKGQSNG